MSDRQDIPWLINEFVPGSAAQGDDFVVDLKMRLLSQLSRMNCHIFSPGFNSGDLCGKSVSVMLDGTSSLPVVCHPA